MRSMLFFLVVVLLGSEHCLAQPGLPGAGGGGGRGINAEEQAARREQLIAAMAQRGAQGLGALPNSPNINGPISDLKTYVFQLTEFRLTNASDPKLSAREIIKTFDQLKKDGKLKVVEITRVTALEQHEVVAQTGKTVSVTTGVTMTAAGKSRSTTMQPIGTIVRVQFTLHDGLVLAKISYEATRHSDQVPEPEDTSPDLLRVQFTSTLLLDPSFPKLIGGTSADGSTMLMVSLEEQG